MQKSASEMTPEEIGELLTDPDVVKMDIPDHVLLEIIDGKKNAMNETTRKEKLS